MPPTSRTFLYWDACVFLSFVKKEPWNIGVLDAIWDDVTKTRGLAIVTSSISIVEVAYAAHHGQHERSTPEGLTAIDSLWNSRQVQVVESFPQLLYSARQLIRDALGAGIKTPTANDALHLATANWLNQQVGQVLGFQTYEPALAAYNPLLSVNVGRPTTLQPKLVVDGGPP